MSANGTSDPECLFCRIVAGETEARVVLERPEVVGFLDHRPLFPGHVLLVPRTHYEDLESVPDELLGALMAEGKRVAQAQKEVFGAAGNFVALNNRISQSVPHVHLHVVPRNPKDGLRGFFWPRNPYDDDRHADETARLLREQLR